MEMLERVYKAVANKKRLRMLSLLLKNKEMLLEEIYNELKIPQATASRNLKILEKAGFLSSRFFRGKVYYSLVERADFHCNMHILESILTRQREKVQK
jgi:DNA-binding transcriptional ArsR family regulator